MRRSRTSRLTHIAVAVTGLALAATACGGTSADKAGDEAKDSNLGLAISYDVGGRGDQSFNDAAYSGMVKADKEFGYKSDDQEPSDGESDADKIARLSSLAKSGYNPVIGVGFAYAPAVKAAAAKYPKTTFGIIDDSTINAKNVADLVFSEEQGSYLAGVAAAKATKSNTVGFVGGVDVPLIHKFEAGYTQGVKDTNSKVKVVTQYLTETADEGGFSSPDKGKTAAEAQIEKGADVVYHAAGLSGQGVIQAAAAKKVWAIGVDSDQYNQKPLAAYKASILTSATKDVGRAVYELAKSVHDKKPLSGVTRFDLKAGGVGITETNPKYKEITGLADAVAKAKQDIIDGKVTVATKP
ncbi:BMP family ABC transporter substrate-binding protein [Streptomyces kunmingensis]|uniref:BMP family ABC transporter substrate-binding protein n=1 Tax=Streptomyces kunmingensis TaxID=68225 RepID=A0ABU6CJU0_9ACTN|nr:BMP family ABC transporter substrate-binding protein [Streptomyces kunmingensis]MEB3964160.1 BMP family ABC transporter substrate-binding protein [Streptomyces kunmingensis]